MLYFLQYATDLDLNAVTSVIGLLMSVGVVYVYCFVGSLITDQFLRFGDIAYESEWMKMPTGLQKFIQMMIADAQRPLIFNGLNIVDLNLNAFTKVIAHFLSTWAVQIFTPSTHFWEKIRSHSTKIHVRVEVEKYKK